MPKYRCQNCGTAFFGWANKEVCKLCGGKLEPVNESVRAKAKEKEK